MLHLPNHLLSKIWEHGVSHYPEEGAGLILGWLDEDKRVAECLLPLENRFQEESRHNRYLIDPKDALAAEQQAERQGLTVIGVFHSHPDHPATPSEHDRQWALPWYSYVITCLHLGKALETRSWRLAEDRSRFIEEPLRVR